MNRAGPQQVSDVQGHVYRVRTTVEDDYFEVYLFDSRTHVGYVRCTFDFSKEMTLCDITIFPDSLVPRNLLQQAWDRLRGEYPKRKSYQGRGLGTLLLKMAIGEAKHRSIEYIAGTIVSRDLDINPKLTEWYTRRGFVVTPAGPGDLPGAIYRIRKNLNYE